MKVAADTNVLVRAVVDDDPAQCASARAALQSAETVAIATPALCEFVWVLRAVYDFGANEIADGVRALTGDSNVQVNRASLEAGLEMLDAGGDFADGVIAAEGAELGGTTFLSFDRKAVKLLERQGRIARIVE